MNFQKQPGRIYLEDNDGSLLAEVTFPTAYDTIALLNHTYVSETLRGQGIAQELMLQVVETVKKEGLLICPTCSYAEKWFDNHPEYAALVTTLPTL